MTETQWVIPHNHSLSTKSACSATTILTARIDSQFAPPAADVLDALKKPCQSESS